MKKIVFILGLMLCINTASKAQAVWVTIKTEKFKCDNCVTVLDDYMKRANAVTLKSGMLKWQIQFKQGQIRVQYAKDRTNEGAIKTVIRNAGFDIIDGDKANESGYEKLPKNCKRKDDGGIILPTKEQCL